MDSIARWPAVHLTGETAEKLKTISPATIDRYLKKDKEALRLTGKSLTKPRDSLKSRIPIRTFYSGEERKTPGFWQIDMVHHCGQATSGQYMHALTATEIWCKKEHLPFTRSWNRKKNNICFVEQKNSTVVREYAGYDRLEGLEEQSLLAAGYKPLQKQNAGSLQRDQGLRRSQEALRQAYRKYWIATGIQGHPQYPESFLQPG
jgi:hypothetical protein